MMRGFRRLPVNPASLHPVANEKLKARCLRAGSTAGGADRR